VNLRFWMCPLLTLLKMHDPDCEYCDPRETCGVEMRERLEELDWRTQTQSLKNGDHEKAVGVSDSKPREVVANRPISSKEQQRKKIA
jgi:hypothetical protein